MKDQDMKRLVIIATVSVTLIFVLEGAASLFVCAYLLFRPSPKHVQIPSITLFDAELGWKPIPNLRLLNAYNQGVHLSTNQRGFRGGGRNAENEPSEGKVRVICSGDSFTFGHKVNDDETWPSWLERQFDNLEVLNLGVEGYGVDQSLWRYQREGKHYKHALSLFAFIDDDFERLRFGGSNGRQKPRFRIRDGNLTLENVGLTEVRAPSDWEEKVHSAFGNLSLVKMITVAVKRLPFSLERDSKLIGYSETQDIIRATLENLTRESISNHSKPIFIFLPSIDNLTRVNHWENSFKEQAGSLETPFINLAEAHRQLSQEDGVALFDNIHGHFNAAGNRWIAKSLSGNPEFRRGIK